MSDGDGRPGETEHDELVRLRREAEGLRDDTERARERAAAQDEEIARLRSDAAVRGEALAEVRETLFAAESELQDLRAVQEALTPPQLPDRPGLALTASFKPSEHRVSGDFYLATEGTEDRTVVVVGDVAGKGPEAARQAAFIRTAFTTVARYSADPCQLLAWANVALRERAGYGERFVTAICVVYDPGSREATWGLAGHAEPIALPSGEPLDQAGYAVPLGAMEHVDCRSASVRLDPGEGLLLYTDGLVEARVAGVEFGLERARGVIRDNAGAPSDDLLHDLRVAATSHAGGHLNDDLCLVTLHAT